jgi:hypothetical protein
MLDAGWGMANGEWNAGLPEGLAIGASGLASYGLQLSTGESSAMADDSVAEETESPRRPIRWDTKKPDAGRAATGVGLLGMAVLGPRG